MGATTPRLPSRCRLSALALIALAVTWLAWSPARAEVFHSGGFAFSDEHGGFRILSVSGKGTSRDPILIVQEIFSLAPVTLVVRRLPEHEDSDSPAMGFSALALSLVSIVTNRTDKVWGGFDLELQEQLNKPSVYGDGLSFDQPGIFEDGAQSNRFAFNRLQEEPYDRIGYREGEVDPNTTVRFSFYVTDPTPPDIFYILQEPLYLTADAAPGARQLAVVDQAKVPSPKAQSSSR